MTNPSNVDIILEQLDRVQARIRENESLQIKYPENKNGLLIALTTSKQLEKEMIEALKDEYVSDNNEVYELHLKGKKNQKPFCTNGNFRRILYKSTKGFYNFWIK